MRFLAFCDFVGTNYVGWQRQPNGISIQEAIEHALSIYFRSPIAIVGCGRTDSGVHGRNYGFHFDLPEIPEDAPFLFKINRILPDDIVIRSIKVMEDNFHARFSAKSRRYIYRIHTSKDPFIQPYSWYLDRLTPESVHILNEAATFIASLKDFSSFAKTGSNNKTTYCDMIQCEWKAHEDRLELHIAANRFLRGMVRLIVGGCANVAVGKLSLERMKELSLEGVVLPFAFSVPAQGLTFEGVEY